MVTDETGLQAIMDKMDAAADLARGDLAKLIVQYPEAIGAIGKWAAEYKNSAGYKRLAKMLVALGPTIEKGD